MMPRLRDGVLVTVTGILTFVSFPTAWAPEQTFWPLIWISHVPLLWVLKDKAPRAAFRWGWWCGTVVNVGGYYWMTSMLETFGHLPTIVAAGIMLLMGTWQGLIWGIWAWLVNRIGNTTSVGIQWTAPLVMVAVEWVLPRVFPAYMGNSQYLFPMVIQVADLFGITAVTFLIYHVNACCFLWLRAWDEDRPRPIRQAMIALCMMLGVLSYGAVRMAQMDARVDEAQKLSLALVEGDIGIFQEETRDRIREHLLVHQRMSAQAESLGAELIIWPENGYRYKSLPRDTKQFPPSQEPLVEHHSHDVELSSDERSRPIRGFKTPLLFTAQSIEEGGTPRWKGDSGVIPRNTAWLLDAEGNVQGAYDKSYLLVFGEYVPLVRYFPQFYELIPAAGNLEPGVGVDIIEADLWAKGPVRIGMLLCYEGILPTFALGLADKKPHFIVNLTNDDWFGETAERQLHLALTIPRAIEHRVSFVRSTLTGVSAFVDPVGRIERMTSVKEPELIMGKVPLLQSHTVYQLIGDFFPWGCVILTGLLFTWGRIRRI